MAAKSKTFLLILEINNVLFHLNNPRAKIVGAASNRVPVNYTDTYKNLDVSYRRGKN